MSVLDFRSVDAKLRRARAHREELSRLVEHDIRSSERRVPLKAELDPTSGFHIFTVAAIPELEDLTEKISLATGDFVHNLRSALDHFAWQLALSKFGGVPPEPRDVALPVCTGLRDGYPRHKSPPYFATTDWGRLHEWQPCKEINGRADSWSGPYVHQLSQLHDLWNADKHHSLPVVLLTPNEFNTIPTRSGNPPWIVRTDGDWTFDPARMGDPDPLADEISFEYASSAVTIGAEVVRIKITSPFRDYPTIVSAGHVTPRVALGDSGPLLPVLDRLMDYVMLMLKEWR